MNVFLYLSLRNKNGQTAEDLAWDFGFLECAQFLMKVKHIQNKKAQLSYTLNDDNLLTEASSLKRACASKRPISKKRMKSSGIVFTHLSNRSYLKTRFFQGCMYATGAKCVGWAEID